MRCERRRRCGSSFSALRRPQRRAHAAAPRAALGRRSSTGVRGVRHLLRRRQRAGWPKGVCARRRSRAWLAALVGADTCVRVPARATARLADAARAFARAAAPDKRLGTRYVPSFIPPSMAAASKAREEKPASVFDLPARGDKGKPRAIDSVLVEMQRCVTCAAAVLESWLAGVADSPVLALQRAARARVAARARWLGL